MAQKFKLIGYDTNVIDIIWHEFLNSNINTEVTTEDGFTFLISGCYFPKYALGLKEVFELSQLQEQRSDLSAQICEMDNKWYEQLVLDDVMNLNDPKQFVMDLCEKLNIELEIIDERNDEER